MKLIRLLLLAMVILPSCFAADKADGGFAVSAGLFTVYGGGLGAGGEYQLLLNPKLRLTPFIATGIMGSSGSETMMRGLAYAAGCNVEFGRYRRIIGGICFGTHGIAYTTDPVTKADTRLNTITGPSLYIGYKHTMMSGFLLHVSGGVMSGTDESIASGRFIAPCFSLGIGYKV